MSGALQAPFLFLSSCIAPVVTHASHFTFLAVADSLQAPFRSSSGNRCFKAGAKPLPEAKIVRLEEPHLGTSIRA
jgi:hypothetical protein